MEPERTILATLIKAGRMEPTLGDMGPRLKGEFFLGTSSIPLSDFDDKELWEEAPITTQLGFPLKVTKSPMKLSDPDDKRYAGHNNCIAQLLLDTDPASEMFGAAMAHPDRMNGSFLVVRRDGEDLHHKQFGVTIQYISVTYGSATTLAFRQLPMAAQRPVRAKICESLNPHAFAAYYEEHRQERIAEQDEVEH